MRIMTTGTVLVVCTGNVCRSPYIEYRLRDALGDSGIAVHSAGTAALVGNPVDPAVAGLLDKHGIDSSGFVSRQLTPEMVREADLVLTATRAHRHEVVRLEPRGLKKTTTLVDFADLVRGMAPEEVKPSFMDPPGLSPLALVVSTAARRRSRVESRPDDQVDIVDPFRQDKKVFARMEQQIEAVLPPVVDALQRVPVRTLPYG